jgi:hypothetical protein
MKDSSPVELAMIIHTSLNLKIHGSPDAIHMILIFTLFYVQKLSDMCTPLILSKHRIILQNVTMQRQEVNIQTIYKTTCMHKC